jgi:hypothetical protein
MHVINNYNQKALNNQPKSLSIGGVEQSQPQNRASTAYEQSQATKDKRAQSLGQNLKTEKPKDAFTII